MVGRLPVRERLQKFQICQEMDCVVCGAGVENIQHLFFECLYSSRVLQEVKKWLQWRTPATSIQGLMSNIRHSKHSSFKKGVLIVTLAAMSYQIWLNRNEVLWQFRCKQAGSIVQNIKNVVRYRINGITYRGLTPRDMTWFDQL
ncbi:uncharacterized protein LOC133825833 [Humulus lupulus]|uniref:uncharacterized protein LOC133825833 n=1 Tax=Humulus lupulus TaxID=3486 RepID=UPI002B409135|nr:uncharacterized protein LOC133825833 [Humulus lupulus]